MDMTGAILDNQGMQLDMRRHRVDPILAALAFFKSILAHHSISLTDKTRQFNHRHSTKMSSTLYLTLPSYPNTKEQALKLDIWLKI
jgi:hypothetical protein